MSFILDAIAKSEQERQQQEVPGARALALPADSLRQPRRIMPYFVVGALLLNVALFVIWMQSGPTWLIGSSPTQVESMMQQDEQAIGANKVSSADRTTSIEVEATETTPEAVSVIDNTASMSQTLAEPQSAIPAGTSETTAALEKGAETVQSEPTATVTGGDTIAWKPIEPDTFTNKTPSAERSPVQGLNNTRVTQRKVSSLGELPDAVRIHLPTVIFSGHLYSSDPDSSLVFVDEGRPVRKGRQIVDGLVLHEITPTGVIVEFRGYLIEVGVLQNWTLN